MKKRAWIAIVCLLLGCGQLTLSAGRPTSDILISPQTLLLDRTQSGNVTVHTYVAFTGQANVTLEGIEARVIYSDDCGNLVAKFDEDAIKAIVAPPKATLALSIEGEHIGSDTVRVID